MEKEEVLKYLRSIKSDLKHQHKLSGLDKQYVDIRMIALDIAIKRIEDDIFEWHACSEEMPADSGWYIFMDSHFDTQTAKFIKNDLISGFWPKPALFDLDEAIAWHKLPSIDVFKKLVEKGRAKGGKEDATEID